jgi:hypothetical protein
LREKPEDEEKTSEGEHNGGEPEKSRIGQVTLLTKAQRKSRLHPSH